MPKNQDSSLYGLFAIRRSSSTSADITLGHNGGRTKTRFQYCQRQQNNTNGGSNQACNLGKSRLNQRCNFNTSSSFMESLRENYISDRFSRTPTPKDDRSDYFGKFKSSTESGLKSSFQSTKELASVDKINDPQYRSIVVAGKNHLGLYKLDDDFNIIQMHDYISLGTHRSSSKFSGSVRRYPRKISTISDVKAGFHGHKNYVAICGTSTSISIYDINKQTNLDFPLINTLSEHSRSINSVDFNMAQTGLLISGGQDGCIKVWDLRSSSSKAGRSDLSINSGSDSIRDVKWMPSYDFAPLDSSYSLNSFNRSYKFASVHDSGLLLSFDLRQPGQVEKKINAHSGPALCLNWHPHMEYIMTGGRDGKCSLWYLGDRVSNTFCAQHGHSMANHSINTAPTCSGCLGTTISTAHPVSKLKFRAHYTNNLMNSMIATSSLGEDADIKIYSLTRKYIPKHILSSSSLSLGFVWWDKDTIISIDKQNVISTTDIRYEPILLDNLRKSVVKWRDIDGNGILFVDQERGGYYIESVATFDNEERTQYRAKVSATPMNNVLYNSQKEASHFNNLSAHQYQLNSPLAAVDATYSVITPQGSSPSGVQQYQQSQLFQMPFPFLSSLIPSSPPPLLLQHQIEDHSTQVSNEPFGAVKSFSTYSEKFAGSLRSCTGGHSISHHNSVVSDSPSLLEGTIDYSNIDSPTLVLLALPHIINNMRISKFPKLKNIEYSPDAALIKSSTSETFKYLARELRFSYLQGKSEPKSFNDTLRSVDETDVKIKLMGNIELSEHNTWATLIRSTALHKSDQTLQDEITSQKNPGLMFKSANNDSTSDVSDTSDVFASSVKSPTAGNFLLQKRINHFIELISICDHNAQTYAYIDDISSFKICLMIKDSLIWDLRQLAEQDSDITNMEKLSRPTSGNMKHKKNFVQEQPSVNIGEMSSSVDELKVSKNLGIFSPTALHAVHNLLETDSEKETNKSIIPDQLVPSHIINLRQPLGSNGAQSKFMQKKIPRIDDDLCNSVPIMDDKEVKQYVTNQNCEADETNEAYEHVIGNEAIKKEKLPESSINSQSLEIEKECLYKKSNTPLSLGSSGMKKQTSIHYSDSELCPPNRPYSSSAIHSKLKNIPNFKLMGIDPKEMVPRQKRGSFLLQTSLTSDPSGALGEKKNEDDKLLAPWCASRLIKQIYKQSVETGNILLAVNIILLFQTTFNITSTFVVKNTLARFITLLHHYELFEISADLLKNCPWDDILGAGFGQSTIRIFCDRCGKLVVNEHSKSKFTKEHQNGDSKIMNKFGYWYCDSCKKPNTLCVFCETPMKNLAMCILNCGHEGHFSCFKQWFLDECMDICPSGCSGVLL